MPEKIVSNLKDIINTKGIHEILIITTDDPRNGVVYLNRRYGVPILLDKISLNVERGEE